MKIKYCLFIIVFSLMSCKKAEVEVEPENKVIEVDFPYELTEDLTHYSVTISSKTPLPFNNKLLGVSNGGLIWQNRDYGDQLVIDLYNNLTLKHARFPSGHVGNFYNWETDMVYDLDYKSITNSTFIEYLKGKEFGFNSFVQLTKELDATSTLMFNVISDDVEKAVQRYQHRKSSGLDISWVELGNENYYEGQDYGYVNNIINYIAHTKEMANQLKNEDSNVKLAINASASTDTWIKGWNSALAQENYYDGVVAHTYIDIEDFESYIAAYKLFGKKISYINTIYPDYPVIITEWGVSIKEEKYNYLYPISFAEVFSGIVNAGIHNNVDEADVHTLIGGYDEKETTFALFYFDGNEAKPHKVGQVFKLLASTFINSEILTIESDEKLLEPELPVVNMHAVKASDGSNKLLVINKLPVSITVDLNLDGIKINPEGVDLEFYDAVNSKMVYSGTMDSNELLPYSINVLTIN